MKIEELHGYATGELHPNEVVDPASANIAFIDSPEPHMPKQAMAVEPRNKIRLKSL